MVMYGADPEELDSIAGQLRVVADDLDSRAKGLTALVSSVAWFGEAAVGFLTDWTGVKIPRLYFTTEFLRNTAIDLEHQATQQRNASERYDGSNKDAAWRARERVAVELDTALAEIRQKSAAEQLAWWNSLTDAQREALIRNRSEDIFVLDGIPSDAVAAARAYWEQEVVPGMIVVAEGELKISAKGKFEGIDILGAAGATLIKYGDGSFDLQLNGEAGVGLSLTKKAEIAAIGEAGTTLHFATQDELDEFSHDLVVANLVPTQALRNQAYAALISKYASNAESVSFGGRLEGTVGDLSGSAGIGREINFPDSTVTDRVTLSLGTDGTGGVLDTKVSAAVTKNSDGIPQRVIFDLSGKGGVIMEQIEKMSKDAPQGLRLGGGGVASASLQLDLTNPEVRTAVPAIMSAVTRGDAQEALSQLSRLGDHVEMQVAYGTWAERSVGFDAGIAAGKVKISGTSYDHIWIRPAGGDFIDVTPHAPAAPVESPDPGSQNRVLLP